jgi:FxsC-like protein
MPHGGGARPSADPPLFFLSYAHTPKLGSTDKPDRWVQKLYRSICEEILNLTTTSCAGFMDGDIEVGAPWPGSLAEALATCKVFVPLYSPRYFESDYCGKEWHAFTRRMVNHNAQLIRTSSAIVPALWSSIDDEEARPGVIEEIQFFKQDMGARYTSEGFYGIIKNQRFRSDYQVAVRALAKRIVEVARQTKIPAAPSCDLNAIESAFRPGGLPRGRRHQMQITVVALQRSTRPAARSPDYYGDTPQEWRPYWPDYPQPIAEYATAMLTTCLGCQPAVSTLDGHSADQAADAAQPGLLLVDAWATDSAEQREWLRKIDQRQDPSVAVIVPWNSEDQGLATTVQPDLRRSLTDCLGHKLASVPRGCEMAADGVPSLQDFGELLSKIAIAVLRTYLRQSPAYPPAGPPVERPRINMSDPDDQDEAGQEEQDD